MYRATLYGSPGYYYAIRQLLFAVGGVAAALFIGAMDCNFFKKIAVLSMFASIGLVVLVALFGTATNGSTRWISIGSFAFQPSEFVKVALVIYAAYICTYYPEYLTSLEGLVKKFWPSVLGIIMIARENLSSAIICYLIIAGIIFVASDNPLPIGIVSLIAVIGAIILTFTVGYRSDRITAWLNPESSFQVIQSLYAIGSGGLFGRGLGNSIQKQGFLPESHNDMIFSVICEELGLFGAICVIAIFIILILRFKFVADNASDRFGSFLVIGVIAHVAVQTIVNIAVVTNTMPNTGVTLPFISYGGSSILGLMMEVGIVLSVSRQMKFK